MKNNIGNLLTPEEVAAQTGLSLETLAQWRSQKRCIPYLKVGRSVRYDPLDVQQYLAGCRVSVSLPTKGNRDEHLQTRRGLLVRFLVAGRACPADYRFKQSNGSITSRGHPSGGAG